MVNEAVREAAPGRFINRDDGDANPTGHPVRR
jgi:hypothetical protein